VSPAKARTLEVRGETLAPRRDADRVLLILDLTGTRPETVARALGLSAFEANQRVARGGYEVLRACPRDEAEEVAGALRTAGLAVTSVPEVAARLRPILVRGGRSGEGLLHLGTEDGEAVLGRDDVLLVVRGPIVREYQTPTGPRRFRSATLAGGYLFHLHRKREERPLEIDPGNFEFRFSPSQGSLLELSRWLESLDAPTDDAFKKLSPALAPTATTEGGVTATTRALVRTEGEDVTVLDNVEQFRFYSGWRGALARGRG
jgi:hypothetical protein